MVTFFYHFVSILARFNLLFACFLRNFAWVSIAEDRPAYAGKNRTVITVRGGRCVNAGTFSVVKVP